MQKNSREFDIYIEDEDEKIKDVMKIFNKD